GTPGWSFNNPGSRTNGTGGTGNMAIADSDNAGNVDMNTELRTPVLNLAPLTAVTLTFKTDFRYYSAGGNEVADVDVSVNGAGGPWTNVWRKSGADYRGPHTEAINLTSLAAGQSNVMIRFHYYNAHYDWWWQVDDVQLGYCAPPAYGHPSLSPEITSADGIPGKMVTYQLEMQNASAWAMAYTLSTTSTWPTILSTSSLTLTANATATLNVSVTIPLTATIGQSDIATITMQGNNGSAQSELTTTVHWPYAVYLPLIRRD
ncbi:MAG TPA: hypothetical protein VMP08_24055, partial [Anaerolineae bacterium]|nr:hypothetical protein [Anaerolineae bacterium]